MSTRYTRGVWSLDNVENKYPDNDWVAIPKVFVHDPNSSAYYAGGASSGYPGGIPITPPNPGPSASSIVTKLAYSTETAARQPSANLPSKKVLDAGTSSSSKAGYMFGGMIPNGRSSIVTKLTYASDTTAELSPTIPGYPNGVQAAGAFNDGDTAGYITGGKSGTGQDPLGGLNLSRKFVYSGETWSSLPTLGYYINNTGQPLSSPTSGYVAGGTTNSTGPAPIRSWVSKYNFSTDANSRTPSMDLTYPVKCMASAGDSTAGYLMGGGLTQPGYTSITTNINKFTYATETASLNPSKLPTATLKADATGNKTDGYSAGGSWPGGYQSGFAKINFTTGTASAVSSQNLVQGERVVVSAFSPVQNTIPQSKVRWFDNESPSPNMGYMIGGEGLPSSTNNYRNYVKIDFDTETWDGANMIALPSGGPAMKHRGGGQVSSNSAGYIWSYGQPGPASSQVHKLIYATDGNSLLPNLPWTTPTSSTGCQSLTDGYTFNDPGPRVSKLTFATDTNGVSAAPNPSNSSLSWWGCGLSDGDNAGYMVGGGDRTELLKLTYSTGTTLIRTTVPPAGGGLIYSVGTNSISAGFVFGGDTGTPSGDVSNSLVNKYTYSTDTWTVPTTPSGGNGKHGWGTGNTEFAVYGQGYPTPGWGSNLYKYVYATDTRSVMQQTPQSYGSFSATTSASNRGSIVVLPPTVTPTSSTSDVPGPTPNTGYYGGGTAYPAHPPTARSLFDKIEYSTNTTTALPSTTAFPGNTPTPLACGTGLNAYFSNGALLYKMPYSTQVLGSIPNLARNHNGGGAFSNNEQGCWAMGSGFGPGYAMSSVTFATDTPTTVPNWGMSGADGSNGTGNQTAGYLGGDRPNSRTVCKYVYATSTSQSIGNKLSVGRCTAAATGNSTQGYFTGCGNNAPGTRTDKLTYSNDTSTYVPGANATRPFIWGSASSSLTGGYITGGYTNPSDMRSDMILLTYANDTMSALPSGAQMTRNGMKGACGISARMFGFGATVAVPTPNTI